MKTLPIWLGLIFGISIALGTSSALGQTPESATADSATAVLDEIMSIPVRGIPQSLLVQAEAVTIVPNLVKLGFVVGVRRGRGVVLVRDETGAWGPPTFVTLTGGSVGWQAGVQATDVILVFKNRRSIQGLMRGKFTLGADASVAAGPIGRKAAAATDLELKAEIYSYSRSRGLFAGVALDGSALQIDHMANHRYYAGAGTGSYGGPAQQPATLPPSAVRLMERLAVYSARPGQEVRVSVAQSAGPVDRLSHTAEAGRRQLAANAAALHALLDPSWKAFLALPAEASSAGPPPTMDALARSLKNFDTVASDPRYRALATRAEFVSTHQALKQYIRQRTSAAVRLDLPPPPSDAAPPALRY